MGGWRRAEKQFLILYAVALPVSFLDLNIVDFYTDHGPISASKTGGVMGGSSPGVAKGICELLLVLPGDDAPLDGGSCRAAGRQ